LDALFANTTGTFNTAAGRNALYSNTDGTENTASGYGALYFNTTGNRNNASGMGALYKNTTASDNNAMGANALHDNTTGTLNNAMGNYALEYNTTGVNNNAMGYAALLRNTTGGSNSAQGFYALAYNTTGSGNIAIGYQAGIKSITGNSNIFIGHPGVAGDSGTIRIGNSAAHAAFYVAGVAGVNVTGGAGVVIDSTGHLGVVSSSVRYKEDVRSLGDVSERILKLRPVSFRYKQATADGTKPLQYGLVAEEVAQTMPELVVYGADSQPQTVAYHVLPTLLLNELQKEHAIILRQQAELKSQRARLDAMETQLAELRGLASQVTRLNAHGRDTEAVAAVQ